jgi:hypothetical protein
LLLFLLSILKVAIRCGCYARQSCCRLWTSTVFLIDVVHTYNDRFSIVEGAW